MSRPLLKSPLILSREEYRRWAEAQPRGRYERVDGEVIAMAPERVAHLQIKAAMWLALRQAIAAAGVPCQAFPDGATVEVGDHTDYEPDAVVNCGPRLAPDTIAMPNPVIVVEVLSPSTQSVDTGAKLAGYFRVPSIQHYLIVRTNRREVTHHRRRNARGIDTRVVTEGRIALDPPGIEIGLDELYAD